MGRLLDLEFLTLGGNPINLQLSDGHLLTPRV